MSNSEYSLHQTFRRELSARNLLTAESTARITRIYGRYQLNPSVDCPTSSHLLLFELTYPVHSRGDGMERFLRAS